MIIIRRDVRETRKNTITRVSAGPIPVDDAVCVRGVGARRGRDQALTAPFDASGNGIIGFHGDSLVPLHVLFIVGLVIPIVVVSALNAIESRGC